MADALQNRAMQPLGGKMAGRVYVADGPFKGAAKLAQMLAGTYGQNKADERGQEIDDDRNQDRIDRVRAYLDDMRDTPKVAEQGNPYEIFTGPQYSQGTPEVHAVPPQGISPNASSSRAPLDNSIRLSYGKMDDHNPYVPASEYQPATQGGELIGGNTHVPAQPAIAGLSSQDSAMKNLFTSDNPEMQELAMKMIAGSRGFGDSAIRTHKYFESLTPEQQESFLLSKRNLPYYDRGSEFVNPLITDNSPRKQSISKNLSPEKETSYITNATLAKENAELQVKETESKRVKDLQQANFFAQIDKAETLLGLDPTASGFGTMVDDVTGYFGGAFDSADVAESLRGVEAWMTSNVPRMEGPQSDNDIKMYKQMAAVIGDSTIPVSRRKAALKTLKDLQTKYITGYYHPKFGGTRPNTPNANTNAGNQPSPSNGETIEYVRDPKTNKLVRAR